MSQAKARQKAAAAELAVFNSKVDLPRLALAIRKLFGAASASLGHDCLLHASLGQAMIRLLGARAEIVAGTAGWRVGPGNLDAIIHHPDLHDKKLGEDMYPGHAWLEIGDHILDLTTWQLPIKAALLDASDGNKTQVDWKPEYLFLPKQAGGDIAQVRQGHEAGLFFYRRDEVLLAVMKAAITKNPFDDGDLETLQVIYRNPGVVVMGPNDLPNE